MPALLDGPQVDAIGLETLKGVANLAHRAGRHLDRLLRVTEPVHDAERHEIAVGPELRAILGDRGDNQSLPCPVVHRRHRHAGESRRSGRFVATFEDAADTAHGMQRYRRHASSLGTFRRGLHRGRRGFSSPSGTTVPRRGRTGAAACECPLRDEVHGTAEQFGELFFEVGDLPTEPRPRSQLVEQVDVAPVIRLATSDRAEDLEPGDAVLSAQFVETIDVDIEQLGHVHIVPRSGHEGDTGSPESL